MTTHASAADDTAPGSEGASRHLEPRSGRDGLIALAGFASAGAALVHAAAAGTHTGDGTLVALFAATAVVQLAWAAVAVLRPTRTVAAVGVGLGAIALLAWTLSRTTGLPLIESLREVEPVGTQDALAAALAASSLLLALLAVVGVRLPAGLRRAPVGVIGALAVLAMALPGVAAPHAHGPSHDHDDGHGEHAGQPAGGDHGDHGDHGSADDPTGEGGAEEPAAHGHGTHVGAPVISLTDERVTLEQREAAQQLIDRTISGMSRFTTVQSVEAAGYRTIGDGSTGWEHFVHYAHMADDSELNPDAIESIVFKVYPDGTRQLASAMYILRWGSTMDDVPEIAGELTTWHDHQNLCWIGGRVVGVTDDDGNCTNGEFRPTAPMLHVWMIPNVCGPFAGIEGGHGSGCAHGHGGDDGDDDDGGERASGP